VQILGPKKNFNVFKRDGEVKSSLNSINVKSSFKERDIITTNSDYEENSNMNFIEN
jgi:hypothetical protein